MRVVRPVFHRMVPVVVRVVRLPTARRVAVAASMRSTKAVAVAVRRMVDQPDQRLLRGMPEGLEVRRRIAAARAGMAALGVPE